RRAECMSSPPARAMTAAAASTSSTTIMASWRPRRERDAVADGQDAREPGGGGHQGLVELAGRPQVLLRPVRVGILPERDLALHLGHDLGPLAREGTQILLDVLGRDHGRTSVLRAYDPVEARVAELARRDRLKPDCPQGRVGSSPTPGIAGAGCSVPPLRQRPP